MQDLTDEDLILRHRADPTGRWVDQLFARYTRRVAAWCLRFSGDVEGAKDLGQEVFLRALENLDGFRSDAKFSTWLYVIARNHCFNHLRTRKSSPELLGEEILEAMPARPECTRESDVALLRRMVAENLDEVERQVFQLHYAEELPLETVDRVLDLRNASGARAFLVSARRKLVKAAQQMRSGMDWKGAV